jgi:hypothetical protein
MQRKRGVLCLLGVFPLAGDQGRMGGGVGGDLQLRARRIMVRQIEREAGQQNDHDQRVEAEYGEEAALVACKMGQTYGGC